MEGWDVIICIRIFIGIIMAGRSIYNTEGGIRGLYRGIVPSLVGSLPQFGLTFYGFEASKSYLLKHENYNWAKKIDEDGTKTLSGPAKLLCGAVAGQEERSCQKGRL